MRRMGIDYGSKRIGIALSDETGTLAFPHSVIENTAKAFEEVQKICQAEGVKEIIMGESKDFKGTPNPIFKKSSSFKEELEKNTSLPVHWEHEYLTSLEAEHIQGKGIKHDASAAALILNSYISKQNNGNN